jgi:hypothetical protein
MTLLKVGSFSRPGSGINQCISFFQGNLREAMVFTTKKIGSSCRCSTNCGVQNVHMMSDLLIRALASSCFSSYIDIDCSSGWWL